MLFKILTDFRFCLFVCSCLCCNLVSWKCLLSQSTWNLQRFSVCLTPKQLIREASHNFTSSFYHALKMNCSNRNHHHALPLPPSQFFGFLNTKNQPKPPTKNKKTPTQNLKTISTYSGRLSAANFWKLWEYLRKMLDRHILFILAFVFLHCWRQNM